MSLLKVLVSMFVEMIRAYARITVVIVSFFSSLPGTFFAIPWLFICFILNDSSLSLPELSVPTALLLSFYCFLIAHFVFGSLALYYINEHPRWRDWTIAFLSPEFVFSFLGDPNDKKMHKRRVVTVSILVFAMFVVRFAPFLHTH